MSIKSPQKLLKELKCLVYKRKNGLIDKEESDIIFERIISDLNAIYGDKNAFVLTLKENIRKATMRSDKINKLKNNLSKLEAKQSLIIDEYQLDFLYD